jgi:hypothetical protein
VRIKETASRIKLAFASNCPDAELFRGLVGPLPDMSDAVSASPNPTPIHPLTPDRYGLKRGPASRRRHQQSHSRIETFHIRSGPMN